MATEGQTATNPQTGARVIFSGGQWQPMGGASPQRGPVLGPPKLPDPYKAEDQQLQREAAMRAREDQQFQREKFQVERQKSELDMEKTRRDLVPGADTTESEKTAGFLATRVAGGLKELKRIQSLDPSAMAPTFGVEAVRTVLGDTAANYLTDAERQQAIAAQRDVLDAALTLGTGAAYTKEQLEGYRQAYFPQLGDDDTTVKAKQAKLSQLLESAKVKAGRAAPLIDDALSAATDNVSDASDLPANIDPAEVKTVLRDERGNIWGYEPIDGGPDVILFDTQSDDERNTVMGAVDAGVRGIADVATLGFADEIAAAGDTIFSGGTMEQNLRRQRGIDRQDERVNPYARIAGQVAGGFALPGAGITSTRGIAGLGAAYGGGYGFGSGEGSITDRLVSAGQGAVIGGAAAGAIGGIANRFTRGGGGGPTGGGPDLMRAARQEGIDVLPADVGGPMVQRITAGMAQTPFGGAPIINRAQAVNDSVGARLATIAQGEGAPMRQEVFGDTVRRAAEGYTERSGATGGRMYDKALALAGDTRLAAPAARRNIDAQIAELSETASTSAPLIDGLRRLGDDIPQGKKLSIDAIRRLRTNVRAEAQSEGLRATDYQRRAGMVLDDLAQDIEGQLSPEAATAFREADAFWKERLNTIDDVMSEVIGPQGDRSAEKVAQRLVTMSRSDSGRLRTFVNTLNPEESGIVRGSLIQEMGRARSSSQGADGNAFSLETFLTNWDQLPERTRALLFKGESRASLENLAKIAEGARASKRFANTSNTAGSANVGSMISGASAFSTLGATIPLEYVTGRLLASPRFARLLASKPDKARAAKALSRIAAREPALAPDIQPIINAMSQSPGRLAAQEEQ